MVQTKALPSAASPSAAFAPTVTTGAVSLPDTVGPNTPSTSPEADAVSAMQLSVEKALTKLSEVSPQPDRGQVEAALAQAGTAPEMTEVSDSRTPTGLKADGVEAGVLSGTQCVMAKIRDGQVSVAVLPVLSSGKCFIGGDR
ncbi:DUF6993 domain-containing protein [Arthrobacter sp. A5]|uniref:DUF6993 domain-containing protein n=1 Tax=Arthrobacter sp. A5 TaxID=576926 RepID=UPI003DA91B9F